MEQAPDVPSIISYRLRALKTLFIFIFVKLKKKKMKMNFARNSENKSNAWNIGHMVDELFVSVTHNPAYYIEC